MAEQNFLLKAENLTKYFSYGKFIFKDISLTVTNVDCIGITGENGSGKSTLLKILAHIIQASSGKIEIMVDDKKVREDDFFHHFGFVSPYLVLYEEFSPLEHFEITSEMKSSPFDKTFALELLDRFKLSHKKHEHIRTFSSGMKQRIKYIQALLGKPKILFLDEPFTNLDNDGIAIVNSIMEDQLKNNNSLVIASNDERETVLKSATIHLTSFDKRKS